jgi:hypothetical protein
MIARHKKRKCALTLKNCNRYVLISLALVLILIGSACSEQTTPTSDVNPTPTPQAVKKTVEPTAAPTTTLTPKPPERLPIGDNWQASRTDNVSEPASGATRLRIYEHYPIDHIQYDLVAVVGNLVRVERACMDGTEEITGSFSPLPMKDASDFLTQAEGFRNADRYESGPLQIKPGCHIDFFVEFDTHDLTGVLLESHCPLCFSYWTPTIYFRLTHNQPIHPKIL